MGDEDSPVVPLVAPEVNPEPIPEESPDPATGPPHGMGSSEECYFCGQRVYVLERFSAEGKFFHRSCFSCHRCGITIRLGGYTFQQSTGRFYCELHSEDLEMGDGTDTFKDGTRHANGQNEENGLSSDEDTPCASDEEYEHTLDCGPGRPPEPEGEEDPGKRPSEEESRGPQPPRPPAEHSSESGKVASSEEERADSPSVPHPVPKPRHSRQTTPQPSPPVPKPRTIHLASPSPPEERTSPAPPREKGGAKGALDSRPKQKLHITDDEKSRLVNLQSLSLDSDSETPGGSSSCSSSSVTAGGRSPPKPAGSEGQEEEGYWSGSTGAGHIRGKRNRRCFRRKEEPGVQSKVRSKFSPWNLSSPRLSREHRLSVHNHHPGRVETTFRHGHSTSEDGADGDDDDDDDEDDMFGRDDIDFFDEFQKPASDPVEAEKFELRKMRTLERRAKMSELQRFRKAQSIQRRLEEIEVTFKDLEDKGVVLERVLRGEAGSGGCPSMIEQWIQLVHKKNALVSEESDLMVASRQLELEDKQSTLELELRKYIELSDSEKTAEQRAEEERVLQQIIEVVDMRDSLVCFLEEKRLKEMSEEQEAFSIKEAKRHSAAGAQVHWA